MKQNPSCAKSKVQSTKSLHKEFGEISYLQHNSDLLEREEVNTPSRSRHHVIIKLRAEIIQIET